MDVSEIDDVIYWVNRQPDFELVSADEVVRRSKGADIPPEAKEAIARLGHGMWQRAALVAELRRLMLAQAER